MPLIHLTTFIAAPADVVFDLSRHIGLHQDSMARFREEAVAGTRMGLIKQGETVTWRARHLGKNRLLRVKITDMQPGVSFVDEQVEGDFKRMRHEHHFKPCENGTLLIDLFDFESPYGILGRWFNAAYLTGYMRRLLETRNAFLKQTAESGRWRHLLSR